ncbi:MAG: hypothetical protein JSV16_15710 [Candidatus Hydrogenedentota bacterium]|nr:MAG: hypothetical protein JSV16_15710 [Candidatus Hydrogenedentota bacterium]
MVDLRRESFKRSEAQNQKEPRTLKIRKRILHSLKAIIKRAEGRNLHFLGGEDNEGFKKNENMGTLRIAAFLDELFWLFISLVGTGKCFTGKGAKP